VPRRDDACLEVDGFDRVMKPKIDNFSGECSRQYFHPAH
jgi:hypothetical protein